MAKARRLSDDSKESLWRSRLRSGLKRELSSALSRTRSGKIPSSSPSCNGASVSTDLRSKRIKKTSRADVAMEKNEILIKKEGSGFETPIVVDDNGAADNEKEVPLPLSPPMRRFTRSLLKTLQEPLISVAAPGSAVSTDREAVLSPSQNVAAVVDSSIQASSQKKLELKISKKIGLSKPPSTIEDLLATGLLEGLPIKCTSRTSKDGLRGTIKGDGIRCSCSSCKGSKVVTLFEFEQHAGSLHKYPTNYIRFENGKCFSELLSTCKKAPVDMLESTIQSAIGLSSVSQNCKESLQSSRGGESELACNKSLEPDESRGSAGSGSDESPATLALTARSTKLDKKSFDITSKQLSSLKKHGHAKLRRKDLRLHKLVFMNNVLPDGTEVAYYMRGKRLLDGYIKGSFIFCRCCNTEVSPSQFEAHAGWASRRKPYLNIYTSNGVSLHELSVSLSKSLTFSASESDDLCTSCADGGDLLLCDMCPRAFHKGCVGLSSVPSGVWYCKYCEAMFEREKSIAYNANARAAGRILGVDPIEQISNRCIRIVKMVEPDVTVCVLCRCHDFRKSVFGPRTVLLCDQCEKEYHVGCLKDHKMGDLKELPKGKWFCSQHCNRIHNALEKLVVRGSEVLPNSLLGVIKQKHGENNLKDSSDLDIRWRLLSGKITSSDSRLLLSKAVTIFHNCFDPIVDSATGRDLIPSMVYGRKTRDQEFGGMYCAVLIVNSSVVSAGILRIFGREVAELPLVATSSEYQGKGYFQSLFLCIERFLGYLNVKNLLLPAADEAESIWTKKFGFKKINQDELCEYTKDSHMMTFKGTSMLHKLIPKCRVVRKLTKGC